MGAVCISSSEKFVRAAQVSDDVSYQPYDMRTEDAQVAPTTLGLLSYVGGSLE